VLLFAGRLTSLTGNTWRVQMVQKVQRFSGKKAEKMVAAAAIKLMAQEIMAIQLCGWHLELLQSPPVYLKWMAIEMVIPNHFLCKGLVHHPIDSQPFINGWLLSGPK